MRANVPLRLARAAAFATVCVLLAAVAHRFGGGHGPAPAVLLSGGLLVSVGAALAAGRERSPMTVIGLLSGAQVLLHELFQHGDLSAPHEHGLSVSVGMLVAHGTASLLTGWWLAQGEAAVWSILHRLADPAVRVLRPAQVPVRPAPRPVADSSGDAPAPGRFLIHAVIRRGPPILPAF